MVLLRPFPSLPIEIRSAVIRRAAEFAVGTVREACTVVEEIRTHPPFGQVRKPDGSLVTAADFIAQLIYTQRLVDFDPTAVLVAEEDGQALREFPAGFRSSVASKVQLFAPRPYRNRFTRWIQAERSVHRTSYWGSDPVDVTTEFVKGGQYATSLFRVEDGQVKVSVIGCPRLRLSDSPEENLGELLVAASGCGAWHCGLSHGNEFLPFRVSQRHSLEESIYVRPLRDIPRRPTDQDNHLVKACLRVFGRAARGERAVSPIRYAMIASGMGDFLLNFRLACIPSAFYVHDHGPWIPFMEAAGGMITDLWGKPLDVSNPPFLSSNYGVLATNGPALHHTLLGMFREIAYRVLPSGSVPPWPRMRS